MTGHELYSMIAHTMLSYNEILPKRYIKLEGEPFEVLEAHIFRKQQRKPVNQAKLRHMKTGKVTERSFHQAESVEEADVEKRTARYHFSRKGEAWFSEEEDKASRFSVPESLLGAGGKFLTDGTIVDVLVLDDEVVGVSVPIKMDLRVTEAPPAVKGNTAQGGTKQITLEGGAVVNAPLFINEGDIVRVNTETNEYVERVGKA